MPEFFEVASESGFIFHNIPLSVTSMIDYPVIYVDSSSKKPVQSLYRLYLQKSHQGYCLFVVPDIALEGDHERFQQRFRLPQLFAPEI